MMKIPLHCIVLLVGPKGCGKSTWAKSNCPAHEIVCFDDIRLTLFGDATVGDNLTVVYDEVRRQVALRIVNGQRAIVDASNLKTKDRLTFFAIAETYGVDLIYVHFETTMEQILANNVFNEQQTLEKSYHSYKTVKSQIVNGDGKKAKVVSTDAEFVLIQTHPQYEKIMAIGDVHGNFSAMQEAVMEAKNHQAHIIWLGDIVDYGSQNLKCVRLAYDTVKSGIANMIWGNHERKIDKWIQSSFGETYFGKLSEANQCTVQEINTLNSERRVRFQSAWTALRNWSTNHIVIDNYMFTHGAATPSMWTISTRRLPNLESNMAFFGEVDVAIPTKSDGYPNRVWNWVNLIPHNHNVVVGHDWLDRVKNEITIKNNSEGGKAFVVDCGSSKGGRLGSVLIDRATGSVSPVYF